MTIMQEHADTADLDLHQVFGQPKLPESPKLGANLVSVHTDLKLEDHVSSDTSKFNPPTTLVHQEHVGYDWGMLGNDTVGDCVIAMMLHTIEAFYLANGLTPPHIYTADQAIQLYSAITGYVPGDESTDQGTNEDDAMAWWKGKGLLGDKIDAVASIDPQGKDVDRMMQVGMAEFGAVQLAVMLPITAQNQTEWKLVGNPDKDPDSAPGSWGGHGVPVIAYTPDYEWVLTWGTGLKMHADFRHAYVVQLFVPLSKDFINSKTGTSPLGLNYDTLREDLSTVH